MDSSIKYALMGALFWMLSFDLVRYHLLVRRLGMAIIALGILLLGVDIMAGMPWYWQAIEGPANVLLGAIILWAARNPLGASPPPADQE